MTGAILEVPGAALLAMRLEPVGCIWRTAHSLVMHKLQGVRHRSRMAITTLTAGTVLTPLGNVNYCKKV